MSRLCDYQTVTARYVSVMSRVCDLKVILRFLEDLHVQGW
jgi:hypothetical protein